MYFIALGKYLKHAWNHLLKHYCSLQLIQHRLAGQAKHLSLFDLKLYSGGSRIWKRGFPYVRGEAR